MAVNVPSSNHKPYADYLYIHDGKEVRRSTGVYGTKRAHVDMERQVESERRKRVVRDAVRHGGCSIISPYGFRYLLSGLSMAFVVERRRMTAMCFRLAIITAVAERFGAIKGDQTSQ